MSAMMIKTCNYEDFRLPKPISSDAENEVYTEKLLMLERKRHLTPVERAFADFLTSLIEAYEQKHYPIADASPREVLMELMNANDLRQKDLVPEIGPESLISMILKGTRRLTADHIEKLSQRFGVSPEVFFKLAP
jgi:HTH-type transcriptional regulator / antitoxin HigA